MVCRTVDPGELERWSGGDMEAGPGREDPALGQQSGGLCECERVEGLHQGRQGQVSRAFPLKRKSDNRRRVSLYRNNRHMFFHEPNFKDDRSGLYSTAEYSRQKVDSQGPDKYGRNHPGGLHNTLHLKVYIRDKQHYIVRQQRKKRERK
eukprot:14147775-Heterocapsa_arctica.AAC.1